MPQAKRRCAKAYCRKFQPCPEHQSGWNNYTPTAPLPRNWKSLKKAVRNRSGGQCEATLSNGFAQYRCNRPSHSVDHIIARSQWPKGRPGCDSLLNLQDLCKPCHTLKTGRESNRKK